MHFLIEYKDLIKVKNFLSVSLSSIAINEKSENVFIKCETQTLIFYINNTNIECKLIFDNNVIQIIKEGEIFINSKILSSLIENLKNYKKIEFMKIENDLLKINSEKFICNLICMEEKTDNYIEEYKIDETYNKIIFDFNVLKIINARFKEFCIKDKNSIFQNINFHKEKNQNKMCVISTDSYKIVFAEFLQQGNEFNINILPSILNNMINLFSEFNHEKIEFFWLENIFIIKTQNLIFKSKLFLEKYPNLKERFKVDPKIKFEINKNLLLSALDRSLFLSSQNLKTTLYKLQNNKLSIEYKDFEKGFSQEEIEINKSIGDNINFNLNSQFLKQLIKNIPSDDLIFELTESFKPIIIYGKSHDEKFKHLILPLKNC